MQTYPTAKIELKLTDRLTKKFTLFHKSTIISLWTQSYFIKIYHIKMTAHKKTSYALQVSKNLDPVHDHKGYWLKKLI